MNTVGRLIVNFLVLVVRFFSVLWSTASSASTVKIIQGRPLVGKFFKTSVFHDTLNYMIGLSFSVETPCFLWITVSRTISKITYILYFLILIKTNFFKKRSIFRLLFMGNFFHISTQGFFVQYELITLYKAYLEYVKK